MHSSSSSTQHTPAHSVDPTPHSTTPPEDEPSEDEPPEDEDESTVVVLEPAVSCDVVPLSEDEASSTSVVIMAVDEEPDELVLEVDGGPSSVVPGNPAEESEPSSRFRRGGGTAHPVTNTKPPNHHPRALRLTAATLHLRAERATKVTTEPTEIRLASLASIK